MLLQPKAGAAKSASVMTLASARTRRPDFGPRNRDIMSSMVYPAPPLLAFPPRFARTIKNLTDERR